MFIVTTLGQVKSRLSELHFWLYDRALHPELFHIHHSQAVRHKRYRAEIWITGLGHVVTFQAGEQTLTQVAAPKSDLLPERGLIETFRFRGERDSFHQAPGKIGYIMSSQVEELSEHLFRVSHRDLLRAASRSGVVKKFKRWSRDGLEPFTHVEYEARHAEFHVHMFHVFCDELTILKTQTIFEMPTVY
jgi:hypothetical protein